MDIDSLTRPSVFLDRTILAQPQLVAALVIAARTAGRQCVYYAPDRYNLQWYGAGQILGAAYDEEEHSLGYFHVEARDELRRVIPATASLDDPMAPIVFLDRAEREGWLAPIDRTRDRPVLQSLIMFQPDTVLHGLSTYRGTLDDYVSEPFVDLIHAAPMTDQERRLGSAAYYDLGRDAAECVEMHPSSGSWFDTDLFRIFRTCLDDNPDSAQSIQMAGAVVGQPGGEHFLIEQVRNGLITGLAHCIDGAGDYVTLSHTTHAVASRLRRGDGTAKQILSEGGSFGRAVSNIPNARTTDALCFMVDNADGLGALFEMFAPSEHTETVGGFVETFATRALPKPVQFLYGMGKIIFRPRRLR